MLCQLDAESERRVSRHTLDALIKTDLVLNIPAHTSIRETGNMYNGIMSFMSRTDDTRANAPRPTTTTSTITPLDLAIVSTLMVTVGSLPGFFYLSRRFARAEATFAKTATLRHRQMLKKVHDIQRVGPQVDVLRGLVDKMGGEVREVRSLVMKDRAMLSGMEARFDALSEQLKMHEQRVLDRLAAEQKRGSRMDNEIFELRKQAECAPTHLIPTSTQTSSETSSQNASRLNKVGVSIADIAGYIDRKEIEDGVLPEEGKESSKRVNLLRDSALDMLQGVDGSIYKDKLDANLKEAENKSK